MVSSSNLGAGTTTSDSRPMNQSATEALTQRYRASLPEKQSELALAWEQWLAAPADHAAKLRFQSLVHKLAGSAGLYGFEDLGRQARTLDGLLSSWEQETPPLRLPLDEFCREAAGAAEMLLRVLGRASRAPHAAPEAHPASRDPFADGEPMMNVLMVEDDADQVALWREALAPHGVRLRHAATRESLEAEVAVDAPDVMLFDYWLEPYTGPQLVRMLRDLPEIAAIPKVCLTGDTGPVPRQAAMDAGFAAVLRKTVDPDDLVEVMRQLVAAAKRR
jgi:CheY-like chemotaxis protein/HPt (histidine-containing phosphotransfer) domain-containing protein